MVEKLVWLVGRQNCWLFWTATLKGGLETYYQREGKDTILFKYGNNGVHFKTFSLRRHPYSQNVWLLVHQVPLLFCHDQSWSCCFVCFHHVSAYRKAPTRWLWFWPYWQLNLALESWGLSLFLFVYEIARSTSIAESEIQDISLKWLFGIICSQIKITCSESYIVCQVLFSVFGFAFGSFWNILLQIRNEKRKWINTSLS